MAIQQITDERILAAAKAGGQAYLAYVAAVQGGAKPVGALIVAIGAFILGTHNLWSPSPSQAAAKVGAALEEAGKSVTAIDGQQIEQLTISLAQKLMAGGSPPGSGPPAITQNPTQAP